MTTEITDGVHISVESKYQPEYSNPSNWYFLFAYKVRIKNFGDTVQLLSRQWQIFDSDGTHRMVEGDGVVGLQPIIASGGYYEYVSTCILKTDVGSMKGYYMMKRLRDELCFRVHIPSFNLIASFRLN